MKNIIIVTGGAGFIGSHLIDRLVNKTNFKIISIDNYLSGSKKNHIKSNRVKYLRGHTKNINKICNSFKSKINTIFHFGEFSRIHQSFEFVNECLESNISGTYSVLSFCLKNKIKIVYSATSASLGNNGLDQNLSPYAFSKSCNLNLIINLRKWFNLKYEILYFYNVYGPGQIRVGNMSTVIGIFEKQYLDNLPLTIVKPGTQSRKFTHIDDTVSGCIYAWKKNLCSEYLLSNDKSYRIKDVALMFTKKIKFINERKGERFRSSIVSKVENRKIIKLPCKKSLKVYINEFKKGHVVHW